ncbi:MAG TPA: hypothetical protein DEP65_09455 [Ruminococcus sp.]|nr:hypothetical protein [Ruminococcus sp.]
MNILPATDNISPLHSHDFFEIMYVKSGIVHHRINSEYQQMYAGDFIIIDLGNIHEYSCDTDPDIINLVFIPKAIDPSLGYCKNFAELLSTPFFDINRKDIIHRIPKKVIHDHSGVILNLIECIGNEISSPDIYTYQVIKFQLISLLLKIIQPKYIGQSEAKVSELTLKLLQIIAKHYFEDNLLILAQQTLHYTLPYLSHTFKKEVETSLKEYLQNYRIDMAKKCLYAQTKRFLIFAARSAIRM